MLDVRLPIGGLFFILGLLIAFWGYTNPATEVLQAKLGPLPINWDILWGILMTLFGMAMYFLAKLDQALGMEAQFKEEKAAADLAAQAQAAVTSSEAKVEAAEAAATESKGETVVSQSTQSTESPQSLESESESGEASSSDRDSEI